ncbi:hypothetical protein SO802_035298 [Lithocarpus litseifolius]|uniref:Uncharacterized protein n=1 Tax=Lithocarpus litseifolius TaxID=425828 RepID=A0AAW2BBF0_9ROSI
MMGILSIKKRHRHRLSIQSVFPGFPNTLLIRKKPPAIEKRSKVQDSSKIDLPSHLRVRQGIQYSDLTGDSSLARAFESKHGHLQLRGSSRSSIEKPGRVNSKVPYSGCKAEEEGEWAQPHQQPAFSTRKELKMKQESVFTIYGVE